MPSGLQIQSEPSRAAPDVEHSAADLTHGAPLDRRPPAQRGREISRSARRNVEPAVVTFRRADTTEMRINQPTDCVGVWGEHSALNVYSNEGSLRTHFLARLI